MDQDTFIPVRPSVDKFPKWVYEADYRVIDSTNVVEAMREVVEAQCVAWDTEFIPTHAGQIMVGLSFSTKIGTGRFLPVRMRHMENLPLDVVKKFVKAFSKKRNVGQNSRAEMRSVRNTWPDDYEDILNITDDIQVIWYLRDPNEAKDFKESKPGGRGSAMPGGFSMEAMALKYLKLETPSLGDFFKNGNTFDHIDPEIARVYACSDADVTLRLFLKGMDPAMEDSFIYKLEMQLLPVLLEMELKGLLFNKDRLSEVEQDVAGFLKECKAVAYEKLKLDTSSNIDSPTQLRRHLFNVLGWPGQGKKTKDGLYSVDKNALQRYAHSANPDIALAAVALQEYKKWKTLHNNFLTRLHEYVNPHTEAIHCSFLSTVVPTGRLACASPNMQQIPQRNKKAPLRRAFIPRPGYLFFEVDYSQIELRVYAGETQEPYFFNAFEQGTDLHLSTASIIFREQITDKEDPRRQMGKTMNFGPIYGMKPEGLAMRTDYSLAEAERILDDFWGAIPHATKWTQDTYAKARAMGGVHTHFGRWRPLPWINSRIPYEVEFGERSAVNTIIQGTAADIMKMGLIRLHKGLVDWDAKMVLTIHDSAMMEVHESVDLMEFFKFCHERLCVKIPGYPPLDIDAKVGINWHDMESFPPKDSKPIEHAPTEQIKKYVNVPDLTKEQQAEFVGMLGNLRDKNGELHVRFTLTSGSCYEFSMQGQGYQRILQYLVETAQKNKAQRELDQKSGKPDTNVPAVTFV